jgi:hypothetical protein
MSLTAKQLAKFTHDAINDSVPEILARELGAKGLVKEQLDSIDRLSQHTVLTNAVLYENSVNSLRLQLDRIQEASV